MRRTSIFILMIMIAINSYAQTPIKLYPGSVPNSKPAPKTYIENTDSNNWITKVTNPALTPYLPAAGVKNGTAVIVCPGGGYGGLASGYEGADVAKAFNKIGVTAFVLKYRLPSDSVMVDKTIGPLQDAQRAIQIVRERAAEWGINPNHVGIIGFSAGGHLASTAATHFDKVVIDNKKNISVRPDFAILLYPVISFGPMAHAGSRENLVGKNAPQQLVDLYSNELQVTANTPPTFLVHTADDSVVPVQNSILFYDALMKAHVKAEMHLYQSGPHGFGLNNPNSKEVWFDQLTAWLDINGWLAK
jgi:acetyl esterase/lipase